MRVVAYLTSKIPHIVGTENIMYNSDFLKDKFFYEDTKTFEKLEGKLFKVLINILDDLSNYNNKNEKLAETTFIVRSSFSKYIINIPEDINAKLDQLPEPGLHDLTNNLIDRLNDYLLLHEKVCNYQYFVEEIQDEWLLKWRLL